MSDLTADDILAIPLDQPHRLFPGDKDEASQFHRRLVAIWHPDRNGVVGAAAVMGHINVLFERALEAIDAGTWAGSSSVVFDDRAGKKFRLRYKKSAAFELGRFYVSSGFVAYAIDPQFQDLAANAVKMIGGLKYKDEAMRKEHSRYMPVIERVIHLANGGSVVVIRKNPDQVMLSDVAAHFGSVEPKHVAWILSSLYNLNCYLKWAGVNHNDIGLHSYFISAADHNGALLGGWWYANPSRSGRPLAVPKRTHNAGTDFTSKAIDGSLIRITGLELLGANFMNAPDPMKRWLRGLGHSNSYQEYQDWSGVLDRSFGARRYAEMKLPATL